MAGDAEEGPDLFEGIGEGSGEGTAQPGGDPGELLGSDSAEDEDEEEAGDAPIASAASSNVGHRDAGDTSDIGSTEGMTASFGGLAGTSR